MRSEHEPLTPWAEAVRWRARFFAAVIVIGALVAILGVVLRRLAAVE